MTYLVDVPFTHSIEYNGEPAELDGTLQVNFIPGDPGVRTFSNGDPGYPPTPPEIEVHGCKLTVSWDSGVEGKPNVVALPDNVDMLEKLLGDDFDGVYDDLLEQTMDCLPEQYDD